MISQQSTVRQLRALLFVVLWALVLFFFTCVSNFDEMVFHFRLPYFKLSASPHFSDLLIFNDFNIIHHDYFIVKLGHFVGFAVLEKLLYNLSKRKKVSVWITVLYAISTEIFQLFFSRDGRIYDIMIDSAGAFLSYKLNQYRVFKKKS